MHPIPRFKLPAVLCILIVFIHRISSSALANNAGRFRRDAGYDDSNHPHAWGYDKDNGPDTWCKETPACCGQLQSPINIIGDQSTHVDYPRLTLSHYNVPRTISIANNGHTVVITPKTNVQLPTIAGGGLRATYVLNSIHYHWGPDSHGGSEHTRDGLAYPLEAHFVHSNSKYPSVAVAQSHSDGLAVFAVFYNVSFKNNADLSPVVNLLSSVEYADDNVELPRPVILRNMLPRSLQYFYRYKGSLTTPPCSEVVTWTIFDEPLGISESQLRAFREYVHYDKAAESGRSSGHLNAAGYGDTRIMSNHRSVQQGHDRIVQHNVPRLKFIKRIVNGASQPLNKLLSPISNILKPLNQVLDPLRRLFT